MTPGRTLALVAICCAAVAACGFGTRAEREPAGGGEGARGRAALAVIAALDGSAPARLARLDPGSLAPRGGAVELGEYHDAWSRSPDGKRVAFGISAPAATGSKRVGVRVVDLATMAVTRDVGTGIAGTALGWLAPRRLVALLQSGEVVLIDPVSGRVLKRASVAPFVLQCVPQPSAVTRLGFVLLLAGDRGGPARLAVVDARGRMRTAPLPGIPVGGDCGRGGLVADAAGRRAFAAGDGPLVAEVDLRTLKARYHRVPGFRGFARGSLVRLGDDLLAAAGSDGAGTPAGLTLIDPRNWTGRVVARDVASVEAAGGLLLAFDGWGGEPGDRRGAGLRAYRSSGREAFRALDGERIWQLAAAGGRATALGAGGRRVVDLRSGRVLRRDRPRDVIDVIGEP